MRIILASKSPRRIELVKMLSEDTIVRPTDADEKFNNDVDIYENVKNAAQAKAMAAKDDSVLPTDIILGVDTIVVLGNVVFGKPEDKAHARQMLNALSGKTHKVISGVCIIKGDTTLKFYDETSVTFDVLTKEEMEEYISTDEPYDKAGAYAVQGLAGKFINNINGCYFNVVGLPVNKIYNELKKL